MVKSPPCPRAGIGSKTGKTAAKILLGPKGVPPLRMIFSAETLILPAVPRPAILKPI